jgi:hypothetical protein
MALQMVDAMAPFAGAGIVNMQELAGYVLQQGFNVKNPEKFLSMPEQQMAAPAGAPAPEQLPAGPEGGMPPEQGAIPPELLAMLQQSGGQPPL